MTRCDDVCVCVDMRVSAWLCAAMYGYVRRYVAMYVVVCICVVVCDYV